MAKRKSPKPGLLGTVRRKLTALLASALTAAGTAGTAYFWEEIVGTPKADAASDHPVAGAVLDKLRETANDAADEGFPNPLLNCRTVADGGKVRVLTVPPGSPGALFGLIPGDHIESVEGKAVESPQDLEDRLEGVNHLLSSTVRVRRGEAVWKGEVSLTSDRTLKIRRPLTSG